MMKDKKKKDSAGANLHKTIEFNMVMLDNKSSKSFTSF